MLRISALALLSSTLIAAPAFAQDTGFYVGGELGATIATETDQTYTPAVGAGTTGSVSTEHDLGLAGSAFAGYDFGDFRLEAEAGYIAADIDELTNNFPVPGPTPAGAYPAGGEASAQLYMANAMADFGGFQDFAFFAGGGAGVAKLKVSEMTANNSASVVLDDEDRDWRTAWQLFAGVRKPLTSSIDAHVRYRYLNIDDAELVGFGGRAITASVTSHTLTAGLSFNF